MFLLLQENRLKFQAFDMPDENVLISGVFERIGMKESFYTIKINGEKIKQEVELKNHEKAMEIVMQELIENGIVSSLDEIKAIGHRIVQGGPYFDKTEEMTDENIKKVKELSILSPLHNPAAVSGIKAAKTIQEMINKKEINENVKIVFISGNIDGADLEKSLLAINCVKECLQKPVQISKYQKILEKYY